MSSREAPRGKPRGNLLRRSNLGYADRVFAEPCEAKNTISPCGKPQGFLAKKGKLTASFFLRPDVVKISRDLLGKFLFTRIGNNAVTGGIIVETEAYAAPHDRASHAYGNKHTKRTEVMFRRGPVAYVYLCYGLHWLFNIITNIEGIPHAVLVRAIQPVQGIELMAERRSKKKYDYRLTSGPGAVAQALGICGRHSGVSLVGCEIWLEKGINISPAMTCVSPRIGVSYAGEDARLPWRFYIRGNAFVSRV